MRPLDNIQWIDANLLVPNDYNPNVVFTPELILLENSILDNDWIFPLVINSNHIIIDGAHRHHLALTSPKIQDKYGSEVPCVVLDISNPDAIMMTVRMNRAKGSHIALRMSHVVHRLDDEGCATEEIMRGLGATREEVELLRTGDDVFKHKNLDQYEYSKAWIPVERVE